MIKGAIFDLDGTLLDSMHIWNTVGTDYLISRGVTPEPGLMEKFKKFSIIQAAEYCRRFYGITDSTQSIVDGINSMAEGFYSFKAEIKPGVARMLEKMSANGVKMCVATATDRHMVEAALKRNGIYRFFDGIFTCTEVGFGKDSPVIFEKALEFLGTKKEETVVLEDALHAIETAKKAGFYVVGVYDKSSENESWEIKAVCDEYITSYFEWVDKNFLNI